MNVGMLWQDGENEGPLASRVAQAAEYYSRKYGSRPNVCMVHPQMLSGADEAGPEGMKLSTSPTVLPGHFWLGVDEGEPQAA